RERDQVPEITSTLPPTGFLAPRLCAYRSPVPRLMAAVHKCCQLARFSTTDEHIFSERQLIVILEGQTWKKIEKVMALQKARFCLSGFFCLWHSFGCLRYFECHWGFVIAM
ncbi:hypothetical protein EK904_000695, partial [Melospiza melodia maxima]